MELVVGVITSGGGVADEATMVKKVMRCRENERQALLDFKQGVADAYGILSSWGRSQEEDCCQWRGVQCSNRTGHVIILDLPSWYENSTNGWVFFTGKVRPSLLELKHLKYLNLMGNDFQSRPIPEFIGSLNKLQYLNLSRASFAGKIPPQLGNLTNLRSLDLSTNYHLNVTNLEWISHLHLLRYLDLSWVNLTEADWLQQIHKLPSLTELHLSSCMLPGTKSPLFPLTNSSSPIPLAVVDLSNNHFTPSSYNWLFNLSSSIVDIDMLGNYFGGSFPEAFGSILSLENLNLCFCWLEGELPNSLKNFSRLKSLDLGYNYLSGSLPDITKIPSLRKLWLSDNKLNGSFPDSFCQISGLVILDFSNNQMTGSLPDLSLFPSLRELYLKNNHLDGRFPKSIGQLLQLELIDVSSNSLEDTISEAYFSNLSKLNSLDLSFNSLALEFSSDWVPPSQLDIIRLAQCNLGTHFPKWLQSQYSFFELDISGAGISDTIPHWFWDLSPRLRYLNISYNQLHGVIPDLSLKFVDFARIDLSSNRLEGPITSIPPNVTLLNLSHNMLTGSIFFLCTFANQFLFLVDLSDNQLSGELPDCWMRIDRLSILNLANNNFSGKIPTSIGFLYRLGMLQLRNNIFIGELPSSLKNCYSLSLLDLSKNELSGEVPRWLGTHLTRLIVISLRNNKFSGSIPPQICYLTLAQVLDLSQNNISGSIPLCFDNLASLLQINSSDAAIGWGMTVQYSFNVSDIAGIYFANALVQWKGKESDYSKTLGLLKLIDLSSNNLGGKIPKEFASLVGLVSLNLSNNNLIGNIIEKIGQMKMLDTLDLSRNQLSGDIPSSLASLTLLSVLDLSNNNFTGKIPSSTQLQSFNASVYAGNAKLCGLPLTSKCPKDEINLLPPPVGRGKSDNNEKDEDRFVTVGFYISVILGFALGFWGFIIPILLWSTWRHTYFKFLDKTKDWIYVMMEINMARLQRKIGG
ncbi:hypothetical protein LguiA_030046 [Lonicera macranthoides]